MFERLGIDSFQAVELISDLEDEFDVELPDYELQGVKTFSALAEDRQEALMLDLGRSPAWAPRCATRPSPSRAASP
jgi:hypothetical protein